MNIRIREAGVDEAELVFEWVLRLLRELGDEADDLGALDRARVTRAWRDAGPRAVTLVARTDDGEIAGISTVVESPDAPRVLRVAVRRPMARLDRSVAKLDVVVTVNAASEGHPLVRTFHAERPRSTRRVTAP